MCYSLVVCLRAVAATRHQMSPRSCKPFGRSSTERTPLQKVLGRTDLPRGLSRSMLRYPEAGSDYLIVGGDQHSVLTPPITRPNTGFPEIIVADVRLDAIGRSHLVDDFVNPGMSARTVNYPFCSRPVVFSSMPRRSLFPEASHGYN